VFVVYLFIPNFIDQHNGRHKFKIKLQRRMCKEMVYNESEVMEKKRQISEDNIRMCA
jgi:hypothetical protein